MHKANNGVHSRMCVWAPAITLVWAVSCVWIADPWLTFVFAALCVVCFAWHRFTQLRFIFLTGASGSPRLYWHYKVTILSFWSLLFWSFLSLLLLILCWSLLAPGPHFCRRGSYYVLFEDDDVDRYLDLVGRTHKCSLADLKTTTCLVFMLARACYPF